MLRIFKIGTKWPDEPNRGWRDGQLVDIMPSDTPLSAHMLKHFLIIEDGLDYWAVRGDTNWKSTKASVMEFKKLLCVADVNGKYRWEFGFDEKTATRKRDYFVDPKALLNAKFITQTNFDRIYNKDQETGIITINEDLSNWFFHEDVKTRLDSVYSARIGSIAQDGAGAGTGGGWTIGGGVGPDYPTVTAFEADLAAQLTGNLSGLHLDEETAISTLITFDLDTNTFLLKLTAESGAEHDGTAYGNGARITYGFTDSISFNETSGGDLDDIEISKLAIDATGINNRGVYLNDGADSGLFTANRLLIAGTSGDIAGITCLRVCTNALITNNIIYGFGNANQEGGIIHGSIYVPCTHTIYNNTIISCYNGIQSYEHDGDPTFDLQNNLVQNSGNADYLADGNTWDTTLKNVSEDATSPDAAYRSKDVHTNTVFNDYGADDYTLDSGGDVTNLAILDDGDDLSGTFTDDIIGQTRSDWYIGASEIVAAGGINMGVVFHHLNKNMGGT